MGNGASMQVCDCAIEESEGAIPPQACLPPWPTLRGTDSELRLTWKCRGY